MVIGKRTFNGQALLWCPVGFGLWALHITLTPPRTWPAFLRGSSGCVGTCGSSEPMSQGPIAHLLRSERPLWHRLGRGLSQPRRLGVRRCLRNIRALDSRPKPFELRWSSDSPYTWSRSSSETARRTLPRPCSFSEGRRPHASSPPRPPELGHKETLPTLEPLSWQSRTVLLCLRPANYARNPLEIAWNSFLGAFQQG